MLEDIFKFSSVNDSLATGGQPTPEQFVDIAKHEFQLVISLAEIDSMNAIYNEAILVESLFMDYKHIPVKWKSPAPENYREFVCVMQQHQGQKIFVHCVANKRASVFVSLYRIQYLDELSETVFADLHKIWQPDEIWQQFMDSQLALVASVD